MFQSFSFSRSFAFSVSMWARCFFLFFFFSPRAIHEERAQGTKLPEDCLGVDSPFFSTIVLFNNRIRFPWFLVVVWKEGSLQRMGKLPFELAAGALLREPAAGYLGSDAAERGRCGSAHSQLLPAVSAAAGFGGRLEQAGQIHRRPLVGFLEK